MIGVREGRTILSGSWIIGGQRLLLRGQRERLRRDEMVLGRRHEYIEMVMMHYWIQLCFNSVALWNVSDLSDSCPNTIFNHDGDSIAL